jgi:hypothetical protein
LTGERERSATRSVGDHAAWRDELVTQALDFRTMAAELKGPALRELLARWICARGIQHDDEGIDDGDSTSACAVYGRIAGFCNGGRTLPNKTAA